MVGRHAAVIGVPGPQGTEPIDQFELVSLLHITRVEPLASAPAQG